MKGFTRNSNYSKWIYYKSIISICFLILIIFASCKNESGNNLQSDIDKTGEKFVPDKRLGIYSISSGKVDNNTVILSGETTSLAARNELISTLNKSGITLIDSIIILPDTIKNSMNWGLATLSVINLRKYPEHRAELVSQAILGTPVKILKEEGSWLLIQTPDDYISWTERSSVALISTSELNSWKKSDRVLYSEPSGWIYDKPGGSATVGDIVAGAILEKTGELNSYINVKFPDGRKGALRKDETQSFDTFRSSTAFGEDRVISQGSALIGIPYLWGGRSSKGADCSGFVQSVYFMNGLILQRDASLQALHGTNIDLSEGFGKLRKGDLLFFGTKINDLPHVTHVAIYIGDSEYINSSGRVMINSLDSARSNYSYYRKNSLLVARRIIGAVNDAGIVPVSEHIWY